MKKQGNMQMEVDSVKCSWMYEYCRFWKKLTNDNIVLDVFIIWQKLWHVQIIFLKMSHSYVLIDLQSNPPKRPQFAANDNDVKGVEYRQLHHVWILHFESSYIHSARRLALNLYRTLCYNSIVHYPVLECLRTTSENHSNGTLQRHPLPQVWTC